MPHRDLRVIDAAERAAEKVNCLLDARRPRMLYVTQLRDSAAGVAGNIAEGFGRQSRADRNYKLAVARGEAEETISRLRVNLTSNRITASEYFPIANLLQTVVKMLTSLLSE